MVALERYPFEHFVGSAPLAAAELEALVDFAQSRRFEPSRSAAYDGGVRYLEDHEIPADLETLGERGRARMLAWAAAAFGVRFAPGFFVAMHRQATGDRIRPHNDYQPVPGKYPFTHRLILYLTPGWREGDGGLLELLDGEDGPAARSIEPRLGTIVGFTISAQSYHRVTPLRSGDRLTLVYSLNRVPHE